MFRNLATRITRTSISRQLQFLPSTSIQLARAATVQTCICRSLATRSSKPSNSATQQLITMIKEEVDEVSSTEADAVQEYIKAFNFNLQVSADGTSITAHRRTEQGAEITIEFPTQAEEEDEDSNDAMDEDEDSEDVTHEERDEEDEEAEESAIEPQKPHYFHIDINTRAGGYLRLFCLATPDQHIDIYQLAFDKESAARATATALSGSDAESAASERELLNWNDLPDEIASKLADFFHDELKIDDDLASFVQAYSQQIRAKQYVEKMNKLQSFISTN